MAKTKRSKTQVPIDFSVREGKPSDWTPAEFPDLSGETELTIDSETTGLKWWSGDLPTCWGVATADQSWAWGIRQSAGNVDSDKFKAWMMSREGFAGKLLIGAHIKFDMHMARADGVDLESIGCRFTDVQHNAALLDDTRRSTSLETLAREELGKFKEEIDLTRGAAKYAMWEIEARVRTDAELTRDVRLMQLPRMEAEDLMRVSALEDAVIPVVVDMECNGAPLDMETLERWCIESERDLMADLMALRRLAGFDVNPDSRVDMEKLFLKIGLQPGTTVGGDPSFADAILAQYEGREEIDLSRRIRKLDSLRTKFLIKYRDAVRKTGGGLLRYSLNQLRGDEGGTISGRFSSSAPADDEGANVQQVIKPSKQRKSLGPKYIVRELYVAPDGRRVFVADAEQIEFREFANHAKPKALLEQYAKDPKTNYHKYVVPLVREVMPDIDYDGGKTMNFTLLYGGGVNTVSEQLGTDESTTRKFISGYHRAFPAVREALDAASKEAERNGFVKTITGRRSRFKGRQRLHKALNSIIQGTAADDMKMKLVELHARRKELGLTLRMTVHDEVVGDVADAESAKKVGEALDEQSFPGRPVPILWAHGTGANWAEAKG